MARYRLTAEGVMDNVAGGQTRPGGGSRWIAYQAWLDDGNVPDPVAEREPDSNEMKLSKTDQQMIRAIDWLLQFLVTEGLLDVNQIPAALKSLYLERKATREA